MKIYKYEITFQDNFEIDLPFNAKILNFQMNGDFPCIWALCDPGAEMTKRKFKLYGTGQEIKYEDAIRSIYIGTIQTKAFDTIFVWHLFEYI